MKGKIDKEEVEKEINTLKNMRKINKKEIIERASKLKKSEISKVQKSINPLSNDRSNELIYFLIHEDDNDNVKMTKNEVNNAKITVFDIYNYYQTVYNLDEDQAQKDAYNLYRSLCISRTISIERMLIWSNIIGKPNSRFVFSSEIIPLEEEKINQIIEIECDDEEYNNGIIHIHCTEIDTFSFNKKNLLERLGNIGRSIVKNLLLEKENSEKK